MADVMRVPRHQADCELQRGDEWIVYPEPVKLPTVSQVVAMGQGRLATGSVTASPMRTSRRQAQCTCGAPDAPRRPASD